MTMTVAGTRTPAMPLAGTSGNTWTRAPSARSDFRTRAKKLRPGRLVSCGASQTGVAVREVIAGAALPASVDDVEPVFESSRGTSRRAFGAAPTSTPDGKVARTSLASPDA